MGACASGHFSCRQSNCCQHPRDSLPRVVQWQRPMSCALCVPAHTHCCACTAILIASCCLQARRVVYTIFAGQTLKLLLVFQFCGACGSSFLVGVYQLKLARSCDARPFSIIARSARLQIEVNRRVEAIRGFLSPSHTSLLSLCVYGCPFSFVFSIWVLSGFEPLTLQSPTCILLLVPGIYRRMMTWKLIWNLN